MAPPVPEPPRSVTRSASEETGVGPVSRRATARRIDTLMPDRVMGNVRWGALNLPSVTRIAFAVRVRRAAAAVFMRYRSA